MQELLAGIILVLTVINLIIIVKVPVSLRVGAALVQGGLLIVVALFAHAQGVKIGEVVPRSNTQEAFSTLVRALSEEEPGELTSKIKVLREGWSEVQSQKTSADTFWVDIVYLARKVEGSEPSDAANSRPATAVGLQ